MYNLLHSLDMAIFGALHGLAGVSPWADAVIVFLGHYLPYVTLLGVVFLIYRSARAGRIKECCTYSVAILSGLVARYAVAEAIRFFYHRPRPFAALDVPHLLTETSYSFPSGHAIFFFALAAGVFVSNRRLGAWLYVAAVLVGLGRVAAGVHYPSDIFGGAILGMLVGWIGVRLYRRYLSPVCGTYLNNTK